MALQGSRLFDQEAAADDGFRPTYPDAPIDEVLGPAPAGGPDDPADALGEVDESVVPPGGHRPFRGYAACRSSDVKSGLDSEIEADSAEPDFGAPTERWFP